LTSQGLSLLAVAVIRTAYKDVLRQRQIDRVTVRFLRGRSPLARHWFACCNLEPIPLKTLFRHIRIKQHKVVL
jgi:hypothetical protein